MFKKIKNYFYPDYCKIYDNSHHHKIKNKKHLIILVISNKFINQMLLERHRLIYTILSEELKKTIYALSIHTYTIKEWKKYNNKKIKNIHCKKNNTM